jgi:hypothetical protein
MGQSLYNSIEYLSSAGYVRLGSVALLGEAIAKALSPEGRHKDTTTIVTTVKGLPSDAAFDTWLETRSPAGVEALTMETLDKVRIGHSIGADVDSLVRPKWDYRGYTWLTAQEWASFGAAYCPKKPDPILQGITDLLMGLPRGRIVYYVDM